MLAVVVPFTALAPTTAPTKAATTQITTSGEYSRGGEVCQEKDNCTVVEKQVPRLAGSCGR